MRTLSRTAEFRRIEALPRRSPEDWQQVAYRLTEALRTPEGREILRPIQAQALTELRALGGLFTPIPVGGGKTLVSLLAPRVLQSKRPLLLLPAALIPKTKAEQQRLSNHWRIPLGIRMVSYEELGRVGAVRLLEGHNPDLIIADEAHRLKNRKAGVTRRVIRYLKEHPEVQVAMMSGTMMSKSLKDFGHILRWTHKTQAPIPESNDELYEWADALDENVPLLKRVLPGPLVEWAPPGDHGSKLTAARRGFYERLSSTPGVVCSNGQDETKASLYLNAILYDVNPTTELNFKIVRGDPNDKKYPGWITPDGWWMGSATEMRLRLRELALGLHGVWDPRPEQDWLDARKFWAAYCREVLSKSRTWDTELQVKQAIDAGLVPDGGGTLAAWREMEPTFTIQPRDVWHDDAALKVCEGWLAKGPGIVWVEHVFFAKELAKRTGLPYFREKGYDANGLHLQTYADTNEGKKVSAICSAFSCITGMNIQKTWSRNLVTAPASGNTTWEQLIGRTHRPGQTEDEVSIDIMVGCLEHWESIQGAIRGAKALGDTMGSPQKLALADDLLPSEVAVLSQPGYRWRRAK